MYPTVISDHRQSSGVQRKLTHEFQARDLAPKDKSGTSDPYLVITLASARSVTHAVPKSLNPEWNISFELPIAGPQSLLLECVCWDKDKFGKDYMGEFEVALEDIFANGKAVQESNWYKLRSKRQDGKIKDTLVSGAVELAFSLSDSANPQASSEALIQKFQALINSTSVEDEDSNLGRFEGTETNDYDDDDDTKDGSDQPEDPTKPETAEKKKRRLRIRRLKSERRPYEFNQLSDVIGVVYLEICKIVDLPPEKNMTRTGFDMDPFVVSSLGQKTYRTRVIRHNLNPVFEEKLVFQVLRHEQNYSINFAVIDRDKLSGNDFVAQVNFPLSDIISLSPEPDHETGLYRLRPLTDSPVQQPTKSRFRLPISRSSSAQNLTKVRSHSPVPTKGSGNLLATEPDRTPASATLSTVNGGSQDGVQSNGVDTNRQLAVDHNDDLKTFNIPLLLKNQERCESKHSPELIIRSKYVTYAALRQQFWRVILRQYDNDNTGHISKIELSTMLDTLGSTLKESTIDSWFQRFAPDGGVDGVLTVDQTVIALEEQLQKQSTSQKKSMGDQLKAKLHHTIHRNHSGSSLNQDAGAQDPAAPDAITNHVSTIQLDEHGQDGADGKTLPTDDMNDNGQERVVVISECPLCHQPRMSNKTDADMITHIATCASQDWRAVNNIVMGDFVTSSQAQRKWYSKVVNKVGFGGYKIGANSANTLVQDRLTGQINEERMSVYVRLGIRLLYKGLGAKDMEMKRSKYRDPIRSEHV